MHFLYLLFSKIFSNGLISPIKIDKHDEIRLKVQCFKNGFFLSKLGTPSISVQSVVNASITTVTRVRY